MGTWSCNYLTVKGRIADVRRFQKFSANNNRLLDPEKFIPLPEEIKRREEEEEALSLKRNQYSFELEVAGKPKLVAMEEARKRIPKVECNNSGEREWREKNWGASEGIPDDCEVESASEDRDRLKVTYRFETKYVPPIPIVEKMGEMFPDLEFELRYSERWPAGFKGKIKIKKGRLVWEEHGKFVDHFDD